MTRVELIKKLSLQLESSQKEADKMISGFIEVITDSLKKEEEITIRGFGTFAVRRTKERQGVHPKTREPITIPASKVPYFKVSQNLKKIFK